MRPTRPARPTSGPAEPDPRWLLGGSEAGAAVARAGWVDVAKGIGIVLVVLGHAIDGLLSARRLPAAGAAEALHGVIYSFHMPLFFLLAGLFVAPRVARGAAAFRLDAARRLAWPYALWSVVQLAVIGALGTRVNVPVALDAMSFVQLLWSPISQFWFLQALLLLHLAASVVLPRAGAGTLALLAVAAWPFAAFAGAAGAIGDVLGHFCRNAPYYALGVLLAPPLMRMARRPAGAALLMAGGALVWAVGSAAGAAGEPAVAALVAAGQALGGTAACIGLAVAASATRAGPLLRWVGERSMAVFLLHIFFVAGARIALQGALDPVALLVASTLAGLAGPLAALAVFQRLGLARRLGLA